MKYIMFEDFSGKQVPLLFPDRIDFAELREQIPYSTIVGAGRVTVKDGIFTTHGRSNDLDIDARPEDAKVIQESFEQQN